MIYPVPKPKQGRGKGRGRHPSLKHRQPLKNRTPMKKFNKRRGGHAFPRNVDEDYRVWIRFKPCILGARMRYAGGEEKFENCEYILQHMCNSAVRACHVKSRGAGGKDIGNMYPGCDAAHDEQHRLGIPAFEKRWGLNLKEIASALENAYQSEVWPCP